LHDKYEDGFAASAILDNHNRAIFGWIGHTETEIFKSVNIDLVNLLGW
jgi:hypothetical protein